MPELPEVETIANGLRQSILNETIFEATFSNKKLREPYPSINKITNTKIEAISRRAKYILLQLSNNNHLVIHLGMSGKLLVGKDLPTNKHDHARFILSSTQMVFN